MNVHENLELEKPNSSVETDGGLAFTPRPGQDRSKPVIDPGMMELEALRNSTVKRHSIRTLISCISLLDTESPQHVRVQVDGKAIGAKMRVQADLRVTTIDSGSQLTWTGKILERHGLLKPIGDSLLQGPATRVHGSPRRTFGPPFQGSV